MLRLGRFLMYFAGTVLLAFKSASIMVQSQVIVLLEDFSAWNEIN